MLEKRHYIRRCHELAILGAQDAAPNPMVGSVIVENEEIIGEGWHRHFGEAHAEINALNSVQTSNSGRLTGSTIFVSLEPCSIYGNTPPCTEAILKANIGNVVVSSRDRTVGVAEISEYILKEKNLKLTYGIGHELGDLIAAPRNIFVSQKRPYFILKWAQSADGFIARHNEQTGISNEYTRRYVHQTRSEVDAILIGKNTAVVDNPSLTNRYYSGDSPIRIILGDLSREEYSELKLFSDGYPTIIIGAENKNNLPDHITQVTNKDKETTLDILCKELYERGIQKVLVEGGATTLQSFIDAGLWDECSIITNPLLLESGIKGPAFPKRQPAQSFHIMDDHIDIFYNL